MQGAGGEDMSPGSVEEAPHQVLFQGPGPVAGTVVDQGIKHPTEGGYFYLFSHYPCS